MGQGSPLSQFSYGKDPINERPLGNPACDEFGHSIRLCGICGENV